MVVLEVSTEYSTRVAKAYCDEALGLARRASNGTTTSTSASSSSVSPCTTTITSIVGQPFDAIEGSCQTVTIVSTPQFQTTSPTSTDATLKSTSSSVPPSSYCLFIIISSLN